MRAYIVDDVLARLDGEVAPIWVTIGFRTSDPGDRARWHDAMRELVFATPRLNVRWAGKGWVWAERTDEDIARAIPLHDEVAPTLRHAVERCAAEPARLDRDIPLRWSFVPLEDGTWAMVLQLHHAIGDARALGRATRRLWHAWRGESIPEDHTPINPRGDLELLSILARHPLQAVGQLNPARFMLSRRAVPLRRDGDDAGRPIVQPLVFRAPHPNWKPNLSFYAGLLAMSGEFAAASEGVLRWRTPWDLSVELGLKGAFANTCMAIPLEFDLKRVRAIADDPAALIALVRDRYQEAGRAGAYWATTLECMVAARLVSTPSLRHGARPGLSSDPRTNTLVVTHVGDLTRYMRDAPFPVLGACGHTPTWGANAWMLHDHLVVNLSSFAGIWRRDTLNAFADALAGWMERHGLGVRVAEDEPWEIDHA